VLHDVSGCYIRSDDRMVGMVGVSDLVIVDTPDALLVAGAGRAQDVKQLYARLKEQWARGAQAAPGRAPALGHLYGPGGRPGF
jgi:hypothetical protein